MTRRPDLRVVGELDQPEARGAFIGPDYARIRKTNWAALHIRGDKRDPLHFSPRPGRWFGTDARRFER